MKKIKKWLLLLFSIFAFAFVSMFQQSGPNNTLKFLKINQNEKKQLNDFEEFNYNLFYVENQKINFDENTYVVVNNGVIELYGNFFNYESITIDLISPIIFNNQDCFLFGKFDKNIGDYELEFWFATNCYSYLDNHTITNDFTASGVFNSIEISVNNDYFYQGEKFYFMFSRLYLDSYVPNYNYIYNDGYNDGYDIGEDNGYNHGYDEGYEKGYEKGYENGLIEDNANIYSLYSDLYYGVTEGNSMPNLKNYKFTTPYYSSGFEITKNSISPTQSMFESVEVAIENGSQKNNFFVLDFSKSGGLNVNRYSYFGFSRYDYGINIQILDEQNNLYFLYSADFDFDSFKSINIKDITNGVNVLKIGVNASNNDSLYFTIACDNSYNLGFNQGYEEGNNNGFNDGYEEGHNNGYLEGLEQGRADNDSYGIAPFVQSIFNGFGNMLSVEIFPSIKLWYLIGIPLIFGIVRFVIGWFK